MLWSCYEDITHIMSMLWSCLDMHISADVDVVKTLENIDLGGDGRPHRSRNNRRSLEDRIAWRDKIHIADPDALGMSYDEDDVIYNTKHNFIFCYGVSTLEGIFYLPNVSRTPNCE